MGGPGLLNARRGLEEARERLLAAGWEAQVRGELLVWRRPGGRGSWYSQEVALELLEFLEEGEKQGEGSV